ncbi:MAG: hypothetical protein ACP5NU_03600 [Methanomicrobiales archaeon]
MKAHAFAIVAPAVTEAHRGQTRRDITIPSMVHPGRGGSSVERLCGNCVGMIATWLYHRIDGKNRWRMEREVMINSKYLKTLKGPYN